MKKPYKPDWNKRPKGCKKTISGMHVPEMYSPPGWMEIVEFKCKACGLIDDTGKFMEYLYGKTKFDDSKNSSVSNR